MPHALIPGAGRQAHAILEPQQNCDKKGTVLAHEQPFTTSVFGAKLLLHHTTSLTIFIQPSPRLWRGPLGKGSTAGGLVTYTPHAHHFRGAKPAMATVRGISTVAGRRRERLDLAIRHHTCRTRKSWRGKERVKGEGKGGKGRCVSSAHPARGREALRAPRGGGQFDFTSQRM